MALTQQIVDEYIAAEKVVTRPAKMAWRREGIDILRWDSATEVDAVLRGRIWLWFNLATGAYNFHLQLQGSAVLGWHFRPFGVGKHRNVKACGSGFPTGKVRHPHEQTWIEGCGFRCARPLEGLDGMSHEEHLSRFCERASVEFRPAYTLPAPVGEQTTLQFDDEDES